MEEYCPKSHHLYPRIMSELILILLIGLWASKEDILKNLKDHLKHFDQNYSLLNSKPVHVDFFMHLLTMKRGPIHPLRLRARTRIPPRARKRTRNEHMMSSSMFFPKLNYAALIRSRHFVAVTISTLMPLNARRILNSHWRHAVSTVRCCSISCTCNDL